MQPIDKSASLSVVFLFETTQVQIQFLNSLHFKISDLNILKDSESKKVDQETMVSLNAPRIFLKYQCNIKKI